MLSFPQPFQDTLARGQKNPDLFCTKRCLNKQGNSFISLQVLTLHFLSIMETIWRSHQCMPGEKSVKSSALQAEMFSILTGQAPKIISLNASHKNS